MKLFVENMYLFTTRLLINGLRTIKLAFSRSSALTFSLGYWPGVGWISWHSPSVYVYSLAIMSCPKQRLQPFAGLSLGLHHCLPSLFLPPHLAKMNSPQTCARDSPPMQLANPVRQKANMRPPRTCNSWQGDVPFFL